MDDVFEGSAITEWWHAVRTLREFHQRAMLKTFGVRTQAADGPS